MEWLVRGSESGHVDNNGGRGGVRHRHPMTPKAFLYSPYATPLSPGGEMPHLARVCLMAMGNMKDFVQMAGLAHANCMEFAIKMKPLGRISSGAG